MRYKVGRVPLRPPFLLVMYLVSSVVATFTPICHDDSADIGDCDWPLFQSPPPALISATAAMYHSVLTASASLTSSFITTTTTPTALSATISTKPYPFSMPSPSIPAAPTHVIREKAVHHSRRPRSKDDQVSDSRDLKHRVRSSRDLPADAFIGPIDNDYSTPSYHNTTKTHNARSGPDVPTVAEQILAGREQKMTTSAYRRSLLASPQVRPVSDVVVGLFSGYTLDCGLTEVPVGWTPAEDIRRANEQAAAAARVVADAAAAAKYHRHETAKGKATRQLGEAEIERTRQKQLDMDENEKKREAEHQAHMHQQELDAVEREKKREAEHQAQMQQQKSDHEAFMQRQQEENDERQRQQQQEVDAALAKAADAAARSQRDEEAAADEREKAEHLIKLREILLEQARLEYRRNALAGVLVAAFLAVGIAVYALFLLLKTLLKRIKSSSRGSKESSTGSFQPPDDHPPPPERPSSPATPDQMPPANDPEPPVGDSTPASDDNDDSAPSPDDDGAPSPDDSEESDPASNETSTASCDAIPVPQNAVAPPPNDVVPPIDREESQKEAEEQKLEVDMSSEAIQRRLLDMFPRKPKQLRRASTSAASSFTASRGRTRSASCGPVLSCANTAPSKPIGNSESVSDPCTKSPDSLSVNLESAIEPELEAALVPISAEMHKDTNDASDSVHEDIPFMLEEPAPESSVKSVSAATCLASVQTDEESPARSIAVELPVSVDEEQTGREEETLLEANGPAPEGQVELISTLIPAACSFAVQSGVEEASVSEDDEKPATVPEGEMSPMTDVPALESSVEPVTISPTATSSVDGRNDVTDALALGGGPRTPPKTYSVQVQAISEEAEPRKPIVRASVDPVTRSRRESVYEEAVRVIAERRSSRLDRQLPALFGDPQATLCGTPCRPGAPIEAGSGDDLNTIRATSESVRARHALLATSERSIVASPLTNRSVTMQEASLNVADRHAPKAATRNSANLMDLETNANGDRLSTALTLTPVALAPVDPATLEQRESIIEDALRAIGAARRLNTLERRQRALAGEPEAAPTGTPLRLGTLVEPGSVGDLPSRQKAEESIRNRRFWPELGEKSMVASPLACRSVPIQERRTNAASLANRRNQPTANRSFANSVGLETTRHNASDPLEPVSPAPADLVAVQKRESIIEETLRVVGVARRLNTIERQQRTLTGYPQAAPSGTPRQLDIPVGSDCGTGILASIGRPMESPRTPRFSLEIGEGSDPASPLTDRNVSVHEPRIAVPWLTSQHAQTTPDRSSTTSMGLEGNANEVCLKAAESLRAVTLAPVDPVTPQQEDSVHEELYRAIESGSGANILASARKLRKMAEARCSRLGIGKRDLAVSPSTNRSVSLQETRVNVLAITDHLAQTPPDRDSADSMGLATKPDEVRLDKKAKPLEPVAPAPVDPFDIQQDQSIYDDILRAVDSGSGAEILASARRAGARARARRSVLESDERSIRPSFLTERSVPMFKPRVDVPWLSSNQHARTTPDGHSANSVTPQINANEVRQPMSTGPGLVHAAVAGARRRRLESPSPSPAALRMPRNMPTMPPRIHPTTDSDMIAALLNPPDFSVSDTRPEDSGRAGSVLTRKGARAEPECRLRNAAEAGGGNGNDDIESGKIGAGGL